MSDVFFYGKLTGVAQGMRKEGLAACKSVVVVLVVFFLLLSVLCFSSFPRSYCNYLFFYFFIAHSPLHIFCWSKKKRCQSGLNMDLWMQGRHSATAPLHPFPFIGARGFQWVMVASRETDSGKLDAICFDEVYTKTRMKWWKSGKEIAGEWDLFRTKGIRYMWGKKRRSVLGEIRQDKFFATPITSLCPMKATWNNTWYHYGYLSGVFFCIR